MHVIVGLVNLDRVDTNLRALSPSMVLNSLPSRNQMSNMQNSWVLHIHDSQLSSSPGPLSQLDESPGEEEEDDLCRSSRQPSSVG